MLSTSNNSLDTYVFPDSTSIGNKSKYLLQIFFGLLPQVPQANNVSIA
jgi:hypothetical protein